MVTGTSMSIAKKGKHNSDAGMSGINRFSPTADIFGAEYFIAKTETKNSNISNNKIQGLDIDHPAPNNKTTRSTTSCSFGTPIAGTMSIQGFQSNGTGFL